MTEFYPAKKIKVTQIPGKGLGVVATKSIEAGEIIETCPILILSKKDEEHVLKQSDFLKFYCLELSKNNLQVLMLGYGLLYNHSFEPNAEIADYPARIEKIELRALKKIHPGEEITYHYGDDNPTDFLPLR